MKSLSLLAARTLDALSKRINQIATHARTQKNVRGGQNLITFFVVDEGIEDPNTAINWPSSAHQRNAI